MGEIVVWIIPWETIDCVSTSARHVFGLHKFTRIMTSFRLCLYGEKLAHGPGTPSPLPPDNFTARLHGKKREPGYDELPLSTDWNISVRMLCVARLGPARRVDSLETVYTRKKIGSSLRATLSRQPSDPTPQGYPTPRARFALSHVNGRRWFISNCTENLARPGWLGGEGGEGGEGGGSPDHLFSAWTGPKFLLTDGNVNVIHSFAGIYFSRFHLSSSLIEFLLAFILPGCYVCYSPRAQQTLSV